MDTKQQPEALRLAEMLTADEWPGHVTLVSYARECVAELRRQHARITELEAQLEAIGAGGVSGPLLGRSAEHFPDVTKMIHWYMVNKDGMATLCADQADAEQSAKDAQTLWPHMGPHRAVQLVEAGSASLSANAGEPVAWLYESPMPDGSVFTGASAERLQVGVGTPPGTIEKPLYAAPQPALSAGWVSVDERLPEPNVEVLCAGRGWGNSFVTACYYDDERREWYPINTHWTDATGCAQYPTHWMPLPPSPSMDGESNGAQ